MSELCTCDWTADTVTLPCPVHGRARVGGGASEDDDWCEKCQNQLDWCVCVEQSSEGVMSKEGPRYPGESDEAYWFRQGVDYAEKCQQSSEGDWPGCVCEGRSFGDPHDRDCKYSADYQQSSEGIVVETTLFDDNGWHECIHLDDVPYGESNDWKPKRYRLIGPIEGEP